MRESKVLEEIKDKVEYLSGEVEELSKDKALLNQRISDLETLLVEMAEQNSFFKKVMNYSLWGRDLEKLRIAQLNITENLEKLKTIPAPEVVINEHLGKLEVIKHYQEILQSKGNENHFEKWCMSISIDQLMSVRDAVIESDAGNVLGRLNMTD